HRRPAESSRKNNLLKRTKPGMISHGYHVCRGVNMRILLAGMCAALVLSAGCGGEGGGSGGILPEIVPAPIPVPQALPAEIQVPRAAAASGAVDLATQATTNVILDPFTHGEASGVSTPFLAPPTFEFTSHVEFEIDLDSVGKNGNDRFPN